MIKPMNFGELVESRVIREANKLGGNKDEELIQLWKDSKIENQERNYDGFDFACNKIPTSFYIGSAALTLLSERHGEDYVRNLTKLN